MCSPAVPLIIGNILQQFYNTIDAFVVGRYAGTEEFAAIGVAGTVKNLFLFLIVNIRVLLSWLLFGSMGLSAVAVATDIGWICTNAFWGICYRFTRFSSHAA